MSLGVDDDHHSVAAWLENHATPSNRGRTQLATVLEFAVGAVKGGEIVSLKTRCKLFSSGQDGALATAAPSADDSSEEDALHQLLVQVRDFTTSTWSDMGPSLIDAAQYDSSKETWRDHPYANRWSRPTPTAGPYAGPIDQTRTTGFVDGHISPTGTLRLRILKDLEITGGGWDITHLIDHCYIEITTKSNSTPVRYYPVAHWAEGDETTQKVFTEIGWHGRVAAMRAEDGVCDVSYFQDSKNLTDPPTPPVHYEVWSELDFSLANLRYPLTDATSLRVQAEVYSTGWHEVNPVRIPDGPPVGFDDSSEEFRIWDAKIQVYDWTKKVWDDVDPWFDPALYKLGDVWRDTEYARSWSRPDPSGPTLKYPGPWRKTRGMPLRPDHVNAEKTVRVRFWKDFQMDTYGSWDIVHAFDYAWLEVAPRGITAVGYGCTELPGRHPLLSVNKVPDVTKGTPDFQFVMQDLDPWDPKTMPRNPRAGVLFSKTSLNQPLPMPILSGCNLWLDPTGLFVIDVVFFPVDDQGRTAAALPLPAVPSLKGVGFTAQGYFVSDLGSRLRVGMTNAIDIVFQ